jgi:hypothetical protein
MKCATRGRARRIRDFARDRLGARVAAAAARRGRHQRFGIGMHRRRKQRSGLGHLNNAPEIHDRNVIAHMANHG